MEWCWPQLNTVIFLCTLESPWTEHSPTNNTLKKWKEKWEQGTTSSINSQIHHGVPILPPCELLPLHSAIQLQNMPVLCGKDHPMQRKLTPALNDSCRCVLAQSVCVGSIRCVLAQSVERPPHNREVVGSIPGRVIPKDVKRWELLLPCLAFNIWKG